MCLYALLKLYPARWTGVLLPAAVFDRHSSNLEASAAPLTQTKLLAVKDSKTGCCNRRTKAVVLRLNEVPRAAATAKNKPKNVCLLKR